MVCRGAACDECTKNCRTFHQKRKDQSPIVTRFFKIMFGKDYSTVMYLPPEFARMVKHLAGQETQIEDSSGLRWSVTLSYVKGSLAFQKGWRKFFQDHDLEEGQLLVFIYIKGSHFNVQIFGRSACEKINFNNGMPRQNKRFKREQATSSEEQPFQKADVNSGDKPISATSVSSRSKFENCHTNLAGANRMQFVPTSLNMEDPTCTIFRDDGYYQGEDRNFLLDLSSFEMENRNNQKEQTKTMENDAQMAVMHTNQVKGGSGDIFTDKLKALKTKLATSHTVTAELMHTDQVKGRFGAIFTNKLHKALDTKTKTTPSPTEITEQTKAKADNQSNLSKGMLDDVCDFQKETTDAIGNIHVQEPDSESSKIAERERAERIKSSSISRKHAVKKERVELVNKADENAGKESTMVWKNRQMFPPTVKVEPSTLYDMSPSVAISSFSTEVKSQSYLELPVHIPSIAGRRDTGQGKVVYLRDSLGRLWPVLYREISAVRAFTANWTTFCQQKNVKPGDKCSFQVEENQTHCIYRVNVTRRSADK